MSTSGIGQMTQIPRHSVRLEIADTIEFRYNRPKSTVHLILTTLFFSKTNNTKLGLFLYLK